MIVTFHLAAYFVYYVWNNYIFRPTENETRPIQNINGPNQSNRRENNPQEAETRESTDMQLSEESNSDPRPRISSPNQSSYNQNVALSDTEKNTQSKNDSKSKMDKGMPNGKDLIYNVSPEFRCAFIKKKIQFFPPVYIQRYMEIERILKESKWANVKKVVDFGCAELSFEVKYLKKLDGVEEIVAVDIDSETLNNYCGKVSPFPCDYLDKRPTPLSVRVFCGSVAHTHDSLVGADAVIAIELIEHLFPPEIECLPFTVFGFIKPKIAIFTTPNSDFNVMFKGMTGFRHPDHKFEWSRQQFEDWANNLVQRYPDYQVKFKGVGPGPPGSQKIGCCSQMATFTKVKESCSISADEIHVQDGPYNLISESVFPFFKDERTEEEKIRDEAESFLTHCKLRSRIYDDLGSEVPIKSVMGRIQYHDEEKLKEMLIARNWEVRKNSRGEEAIVLPDSETEDSEPESNDYVTEDCGVNFDGAERLLETEENWDDVDGHADMDTTLTDSLYDSCNIQSNPWREHSNIHTCVAEEGYHSLDTVNSSGECSSSTNSGHVVSSSMINSSFTENCPTLETAVPEPNLSDKFSSSIVERLTEKDTNLNFERSVYETPHSNHFHNGLKSDCDLCDCCLPISNHAAKDCKKALIMDSPKEFAQFEVGSQDEDHSFCLSTLSSSCDTSIYATPCCSQRHRNIPKCLSLQQLSTCNSPAFGTELDTTLKESRLLRVKKDKLSKSMEGVKSLENDLTYSSTSKVVDSGYPDSYSECNMDMDLTPEQFDDIETESEENDASSRSMSPAPLPPQVPRLIDDVQNGDVANNNRDGEGNNLVADMEEEALEFEARIDEINNEVLNLAAANDEIDSDMQPSDPIEVNCDFLPCLSDLSSMTDMPDDHQGVFEKPNIDSSKMSVFTEKNNSVLNDSMENHCLRSTKSDTNIAPKCSLHVNSSGFEKNKSRKGSDCSITQSNKFKTFNSLTTVLDGHSKFSDCSLVRPIEVYRFTENSSVPDRSMEPDQQEDSQMVHGTESSTSTALQEDRQSLKSQSVYQSAESLDNLRGIEQNNEFPGWLLNILNLYGDENEVESADSMISVWDSDISEPDDRLELNYDVQVDTRGGGDPQPETGN